MVFNTYLHSSYTTHFLKHFFRYSYAGNEFLLVSFTCFHFQKINFSNYWNLSGLFFLFGVWVYNFHQFWKNIGHYLFKYIFSVPSSLLGTPNDTCVRLLVSQVIEVLYWLFPQVFFFFLFSFCSLTRVFFSSFFYTPEASHPIYFHFISFLQMSFGSFLIASFSRLSFLFSFHPESYL